MTLEYIHFEVIIEKLWKSKEASRPNKHNDLCSSLKKTTSKCNHKEMICYCQQGDYKVRWLNYFTLKISKPKETPNDL